MTTAQAQAKPFDMPVGNTGKVEHVEHRSGTLFQFETVRSVVENDNFLLVLHPYGYFSAESDWKGPITLMFYDKDEWLHMLRIGQKRILRHIATNIMTCAEADKLAVQCSREDLKGGCYDKNPLWKGKCQLTRDSKAGEISVTPFQD